MSSSTQNIESRLWEAADHLRANSPLRLNEFAEPVLGLIFLKFADVWFTVARKEIESERQETTSKRQRPISPSDYQARGVLFVPEKAHFSYLISLPEGTDLGKEVNEAMKAIEEENKELAGILPKSYQKLDNQSVITLLKNFNQIPDDAEGDTFGKIYEYFLGKFALSDGRGGGEFFTPSCIVKLIVEIIEPYHGKIYDPACGSGGMFVQSHEFVKRHLKNSSNSRASREISIYGQEKTEQTAHIAKMNLAIHGLSGDIRQGNTYYEDSHKSFGKFDYTLANPPFNVDGVDKARIKDDPRFLYGIPRSDNGNYLWIQIFLNSLKENGRAGFVMANSASDAGHSEKEIRQKLIEDGVVDVMIAVGPNMFYNVALPVTLWFLDKSKKNTERKDKILFIDARNIYRQIDRAHRDWTNEQVAFISNIARLYREEQIENFTNKMDESIEKLETEINEEARKENIELLKKRISIAKELKEEWNKHFSGGYQDVKGLSKVSTIEEVKKAGYSLNPGRYVGITDNGEKDDEDFEEKLETLHKEFKNLTSEAHELEKKILDNLKKIQHDN